MKPEIYFSTDIETDGPIPGGNSMLSFASAAFDGEGKLIGTFTANLEELVGARQDPRTMEWWVNQPNAWSACRANPQPPRRAMKAYADFVAQYKSLGRPVFVAYPAGFDFLFVYWYLMHFNGESPFSFSALDVKTLAYAAQGCFSYNHATKRNWPREWLSPKTPHTHVALDDAIEQGHQFFRIRESISTNLH